MTPDEFYQFVVRLDEHELDSLIEFGPQDYGHFEESYPVAVILGGAEIEDMSVDDIFSLIPAGSTPVDFARACVLVGADVRAAMPTVNLQGA